ncbi:hypothetical protein [Chryseobacterium gambrini]|uniref:hypothetical protein n=1 Tax=Chryseobacterium gambrini TaxID=373672 RepID=UPI0025B4A915|nr:hypothetical protein [Chryseobacterium gambrini]MDN4028071.1 hypothetical protein [Chryseobacterium gambrini]
MYLESGTSVKKFRFLNSEIDLVSRNVDTEAKSIENALGRAIPVLIGFLASLLGIGGLADKILGVIRKIRQRIENAIVKFWNFIKGKAGNLLGKLGIRKLGLSKKENINKMPDGKEKLFAKLRNDEQKINVDGGHKLKFENEGELAVYSTRIGLSELLRQKQEEIHSNKTSRDYSKKQAALNKLSTDKKNFGQALSKYKGKQAVKYTANVKEEYNTMKRILTSMAASLEVIGVNIETISLVPTQVNMI